ncbi:MAG TPA: type 1 glutamine amidotransferase domain-containing protein [Gemmatimonadaceae bacterium]|jgi:protease I|nr:type 1 glutamine amidotransferase domain-containing protein [Gemmatimonadaceae bacterium]
MARRLGGMRIAVLATDGVEQIELTEPVKAAREAGATVHLISLEAGEIQGFNHLDKGDRFPVDRVLGDVSASMYDALLLPGGVANPDRLRMEAKAVQFVREFMASDKPVAAICHAPWLLVEADVVAGRTLTSWPSLQTDIRNAGAEWVDREVQVDGRLVTSRKPDDLPAFNRAMVERFADASANERVDEAVEESFPASDPPAWTPSMTGGTGHGRPESRP